MTDWSRYQKCPVCHAELGQPCLALSGRNTNGPVAVAADEPHSSRKLRSPDPNGAR